MCPPPSPQLNQPPLLGQISASLAAMQRTIEDYDAMIKREIIKAKQEKGQMYVLCQHPSPRLTTFRRVQKFRADYGDLKSQFERIKNEVRCSVHRVSCHYSIPHREPPRSAMISSAHHQAFTHRPHQTREDALHQLASCPHSTPSLLSEHRLHCQTLPYASITHFTNIPSSKAQRHGSTNSSPRDAKSWTTLSTSATC